MKTYKLSGELRSDFGKRSSKDARSAEKVPCVLYGGAENVHFTVSEKELAKLIYTPEVFLIKITIGSKVYNAVMRDIQFHPVSDKVLHIDFFETSENKPVVVEVPVKTVGFAEGVKAGGKLSLVMRKLKVKALPKDMPSELSINIESLGLGKSIKVKDVALDNIEIVNSKDVVVIQIKLTRAARAANAGK